jgi:hypothetical protein
MIHFKNGGYHLEGKWHISSRYPRDVKGDSQARNEEGIEINIAETKTPEQIARDIQKRFMPSYEENLTLVMERIKRSNEYHLKAKATIDKLSEYFLNSLGKEPQKANQDPWAKTLYVYDELPGLGSTIEVSGDEVTFKVSVKLEKAIEIFEMLRI